MNAAHAILVILVAFAQIVIPRRYAYVPLLISAAHFGSDKILFDFSPARIVMIVGLIRAFTGGFLFSFKRSPIDRILIAFAFFAILSTFGHKADPWTPSPFTERVGIVLNVLGTYLYGRAYLPDIASFKRYILALVIILAPLALCMVYEKRTENNPYSYLGIADAAVQSRDDKVRAMGSFTDPILAGCAGATALPFAYLLWRLNRKKAALFAAAVLLTITISCSSSGPLAALGVTGIAIALWRYRSHLPLLIKLGIVGAFIYPLIFREGPWFLMAKIDLVGGSTGDYRAWLIENSIRHLDEWWLYGTDYTRHWMLTGLFANPNHADIVNYYIKLGVTGGLPLMLCLVALLIVSYKLLVRRMGQMRSQRDENEIVLWCAGASLAAHAISFVSIAYFDKIYVFFYLLLGIIPGLINDTETHDKNTHKAQEALPESAPPPEDSAILE